MVIWKGLLRYPWGQPKLSSQLKMRLKSGKTTCYFNHATLLVALWYSIYVLLAQIRTTWVASTYLFTYALTAKLKHIGLLKSVNLKGPNLWSKRGKFSTSKKNTYSRKIRNLADSKYWWKSVERFSELKTNFIHLDTIQWTLKPSPKDICIKVFVLSCRRNATQFEAHSTNKRMLGTKFLDLS